jgi:hypothetical protein
LEGLRYVAASSLFNCATFPTDEEEKMSLLKFAAVATALLSAASALADDARTQDVLGAWQPRSADVSYAPWTVLVFSEDGRFAALVTDGPGKLDPVSGKWMLAQDQGELVLAFDNPSVRQAPGTTRYLQMLLLGDELAAYPGMEDRSPIAATPWRRVLDASSSGPERRAAR